MATITANIDDETDAFFRDTVKSTLGEGKGKLGKAIDEALKSWAEEKSKKALKKEVGFLLKKDFIKQLSSIGKSYMTDKIFLDTNILVYAFEFGESEKKKISAKLYLLPQIHISNQVISEFSYVLLRKAKLEHKLVYENIEKITSLDSVKIVNYSKKSVIGALKLSEQHKIPFWDALIAQTAIENGITLIYTENSSHFKGIPIKVTNPFEKIKTSNI